MKTITDAIVAACALTQFRGPGTCKWCGKTLAGRRRAWCSDDCQGAFASNHFWNAVRPAALERDDWTCRRCGLVGWWESSVRLLAQDPEVARSAPRREDWAIAMGLLAPEDWRGPLPGSWEEGELRRHRVNTAKALLPEILLELTTVEYEMERRSAELARPRRGRRLSHELEVNHIRPVRGDRTPGCHNHQDNLETLCLRCHQRVTRLQITSARMAGGTRTIACWEGEHEECWGDEENCYCEHHATDEYERRRRVASLGPQQAELGA